MFDEGIGLPEDNTAAIDWYTRAAEQGDAMAQNNLGAMYDEGEGTSMNDKEAVKWYRLSANQGNTIAQNNLGAMYFAGEGIRKNSAEAYKWFYIAGELGNEDARSNLTLAEKRLPGSHVKKGTKLALKWLKSYGGDSTDTH
jgi:hypothetical protein